MKTLRFIGMAIIAVIVSVNFAACSSDDDEEDNGGGTVVSGKLLKSITKKTEHSTYTSTFTYNDKKQLISASNGYGESINITWSESSITVETVADWKEEPATFLLKNGIITSVIGNYSYTLTYNNKQLTKAYGGPEDDFAWEWANGNIKKFISKDGSDEETLTCTYYTDKENKHSIIDINALDLDDIAGIELGDLLLIAHPNLLGTTNKNLLKGTEHNDGDKTSYTYELDNEGYPVRIVETYTKSYGGSSSTETETYILTWQ
ncbi:hypothetical protein [Phocaeicola sp.]